MDYRLESLRYQLQEDPTSRVFFQLGELLRKEGQLQEAVRTLEGGLAHHPRYVAAWVSLGRAQHDLGAHARAEAAFAHALEIDPENQVAARQIGESAIARADYVRAVKALKLARALAPRDPELDERILWVERRLAAEGQLEVPVPTPTPSVVAAEAVDEPVFPDADVEPPPVAAAPRDRDWPTEPDFEPPPPGSLDEPFGDLPEEPPAEPPRALEAMPRAPYRAASTPILFAGADADPFTVGPSADTGVWVIADDVFGGPIEEEILRTLPEETVSTEDAFPLTDTPPLAVDGPVVAEEPSRPAPVGAFDDEPFGGEALPPPEMSAATPGPFEEQPPASQEDWQEPPAATTQQLHLSSLPPPEAAATLEALGESAVDAFEPELEALPSVAAPDDELPAAAPPAELEEVDFSADGETTLRLPPWPEPEAPPAAEPPRLVLPDLEPLDLEPEPDDLEEEPLAQEVPLPTLTLARLALAQGDLDLAERTLESLLRHHPESTEAAHLLDELMARREVAAPVPAAARPSPAARVAALQGWLDRIRLAAERRTR